MTGPPATAFKILTVDQWDRFRTEGRFDGSPVDRADGYIHLSAAEQVAGTLARHLAGRTGLVVVEVDLAALGAAVRWESSRGGALFPHLYGTLPMAAIVSTRRA